MVMVKQIWLLVIRDEKIISRHFEELGLGEFINPIKADYSAAMADIISRYKNGKSVLFYTWTNELDSRHFKIR